MAYQKIERPNKFQGFFDYTPGNILEGKVKDVIITGKTDNGKETGYVGVETIRSCKAQLDQNNFESKPGDIIACSLTAATRVLIGTEGKLVRLTFRGFKTKERNGEKQRLHDWDVEIDDGQGEEPPF